MFAWGILIFMPNPMHLAPAADKYTAISWVPPNHVFCETGFPIVALLSLGIVLGVLMLTEVEK